MGPDRVERAAGSGGAELRETDNNTQCHKEAQKPQKSFRDGFCAFCASLWLSLTLFWLVPIVAVRLFEGIESW
jgi:hypothetical protein